MQLQIPKLSEVVRKRKTNTIYHSYVNLKYGTNEAIYKTETDSQTYGYQRGQEEGEEIGWELRIGTCTQRYME